jgi:hypothetical protein
MWRPPNIEEVLGVQLRPGRISWAEVGRCVHHRSRRGVAQKIRGKGELAYAGKRKQGGCGLGGKIWPKKL